MYLFYVVDALDIKKIEKNEYFCMLRFFPDFYDFSLHRINPITISATLFRPQDNHGSELGPQR